MRWECIECGCRIERPQPPPVCRSCGTAGAVFVEAERSFETDPDAESMFEAWTRRGKDNHRWLAR
jgi:hypothetical protein